MTTAHTTPAPASTAPRSLAVWHTVPGLDEAMQAAARLLARFSRINHAAAFWHTKGASFWDAWKEHQGSGAGSLTVRMGRLELVTDWGAKRPR